MLADWYKVLCDYYAKFQTNCPYHQYAGHIVLGLFVLLFFCLWRRAKRKITWLKGENHTLFLLADKASHATPMYEYCSKPSDLAPSLPPSIEVSTLLSTFQQMHMRTVDTLKAANSDALAAVKVMSADALNRLQASQAVALEHIDNVVRNLVEDDDE